MTVLPTDRARAMHEAAHAAAALKLGVPLSYARTDYPEKTLAGSIGFNFNAADLTDIEGLYRRVLHVILMGPMSEGRTAVAHDFPLDPDDFPVECRLDISHAILLAKRLDLDAVSFGVIAHAAHTMWRDPDFRGLVVAIADQLEDLELLLPHELEAIHKEALQ